MNVVKRYIPEKVYDKIQTLNYKNVEHLYVVCDMIYRSTIYKKENKNYSNQFIDIPEYYFSDLIQRHSMLKDAKNILVDNKIIECDNVYSKKGGKALGYKFSDGYISKLLSVNITSKPISKRVIKNKNDRNNAVNQKLHQYREYFLNSFKIDYKKSMEYLDNWFNNSINSINSLLCSNNLSNDYIKLVNKYNHIFISLSSINDGDLYFRKNDTNGRIDTNLTSLKSEYKQFIVSKEPLYQIDIVNSQPFILSLYLNSLLCSNNLNKDLQNELLKYNDWTGSGLFYEMFEKTYFNKTGKTLTRKMIKDMMFCIFYSKNSSFKKEKSIFISVFPNIMNIIEKEKENKHNEFAIKLQKIESKICIDIISQELDIEGIEYYTIHDAWLVSKEDIQKTKNIIMNKFYKYFHRRPEMKIEKINF
jgi:hypothetical protein